MTRCLERPGPHMDPQAAIERARAAIAAATRAALRLYPGARSVSWQSAGWDVDRTGRTVARHYRRTICGRPLPRKRGGGSPVVGECRSVIKE